MAGIGFEIRKILRRDSYMSMLSAYAYAGIIGSGRGYCPFSACSSSVC
jgi:Predicted membrane protein